MSADVTDKLQPVPETRIIDRIVISELPAGEIKQLDELNYEIFHEERIINNPHNDKLLILVAKADDRIIGFKAGYPKSKTRFYSAKGCVQASWRRHGIARRLMLVMMAKISQAGYKTFAYHTFPNRHPGMLIMGLQEGFRVIDARFNKQYGDFQIELEADLESYFNPE